MAVQPQDGGFFIERAEHKSYAAVLVGMGRGLVAAADKVVVRKPCSMRCGS